MSSPFVDTLDLNSRVLVEASAGTGKTYTITELYLRLVHEKNLPVGQILVLTYTNAATAELRQRIRQRLGQAQSVASTGQAQAQLNAALESFDEAAIYTIHSFCQKVLSEEAFISAEPFSFEVARDRSVLLNQIAQIVRGTQYLSLTYLSVLA